MNWFYSNQKVKFVDSSGSDLYHTCYCLSGLSLFQDGGQDQMPIVCGIETNKLVRRERRKKASTKRRLVDLH